MYPVIQCAPVQSAKESRLTDIAELHVERRYRPELYIVPRSRLRAVAALPVRTSQIPMPHTKVCVLGASHYIPDLITGGQITIYRYRPVV